MENKSIQPRFSQSGQSEAIKLPAELAEDEKIEIEFREIVRVYPKDFVAVKKSFEAWASEWH